MGRMDQPKRVAILGGGLAGIAAATALSQQNDSAGQKLTIDLYEARSRLGGRASSYQDATTGELIDFCQHVSMGCCTKLDDLCQQLGVDQHFRRLKTLHFIGPDSQQYDMRASWWLPAPLHLLPSFFRLDYLTWKEKWQTVRLLLRLKRTNADDVADQTMDEWLQRQGASPSAIRRFWEVVLVSALGEMIDRVSVKAARKVFVDAFLGPRGAQDVLVPEIPLGELYGEQMCEALRERGVNVRLSSAVRRIAFQGEPPASESQPSPESQSFESGPLEIETGEAAPEVYDHVVLATTWRQVGRLLSPELATRLPELAALGEWTSAPITGIHLWFDRRVCDLDHAVLIERMSHWLFYCGCGPVPLSDCTAGHYYQVVISASHSLVGADSSLLIERVCDELRSIWPQAGRARLMASKVVTERHAIVSPTPRFERQRPGQRTAVEKLTLAGDWTATGWPSTMESAVRSGYLAAEEVLGREMRDQGGDCLNSTRLRSLR